MKGWQCKSYREAEEGQGNCSPVLTLENMSLSSKGMTPDGVEGVVEASLAHSQHVDVAVEAEAVMTSPN